MNKGAVKAAAICLVSVTLIASAAIETNASALSAILPAAGTAQALKEGKSVEEVKTEQLAKNTKEKGTQAPSTTVKSDKALASNRSSLLTGFISSDASAKTPEPTFAPQKVIEEKLLKDTVSDNTAADDKVEELPKNETVTEGTDKDESVTEQPDADKPANGETPKEEATPDNTGNKTDSNGSPNIKDEAGTEEVVLEVIKDGENQAPREDFSDLIIATVDNFVNVRAHANEESEIVGKLYDDSAGVLVGTSGDWYKIKSGNVTGFVSSQYVAEGERAETLAKEVGTKMATVQVEGLRVRVEPTIDSSVLGYVPIEDSVVVVSEPKNGWVKVSIGEGDGYVKTEFVNIATEFVKAESKWEEEARLEKEEEERKQAQEAAKRAQEERDREAAAKAKEAAAKNKKTAKESTSGKQVKPASGSSGGSVANFATQFVGNSYVYGGTSLTNGADCSGFVMSVYQNFGVSLPRTSGAQRGAGYDVGGIGNAQPGDLVCYSGHIGIYVGGGNIVHASTAATGIKISNASYRPILAVKRIF